MQTKNTKQGGFTLVEIAIVLVIIGLLLGGILKGQELINNAKVRSVADRQNSLKAAWFGFIDRYNFIPGDSNRAVQLVPGAEGRGDGEAGNGRLIFGESTLAMQQLTGAGFLRCPQCDGADGKGGVQNPLTAANIPSADNSLVNQYSGVMSIWNEDNLYAERQTGTTGRTASEYGRLQIHSGPRIPSNILSEVDRKIDDGIANSGDMVFNTLDPSNSNHQTATADGSDLSAEPLGAPSAVECMNGVGADFTSTGGVAGVLKTATAELLWRTSDRNPAVENNCGSSIFI